MRQLFLSTLWLWAFFAHAETAVLTAVVPPADSCPTFNFPAPVADSCHLAPFFCGNYLGHYCGSLQGLTDDSLAVADSSLLRQAGFLRFSPCDTAVAFAFEAGLCGNLPGGLQVTLLSGHCQNFRVLDFWHVEKGDTDTLHLQHLIPGIVYYLAISAYGSEACDFSLRALEGIGTSIPDVNAGCICTDAEVLGPDTLCAPNPAFCSFKAPACQIPIDSTAGGNGLYCGPPPGICAEAVEKIEFIWHIPESTHFVGDSTGGIIQIAPDSALFRKDTLIQDSVWVEIKYTYSSEPIDSLAFCLCAGTQCSYKILAKPITILFNIQYVKGSLSCAVDSFQVDSVVYRAPGTYYQYGEHCKTVIIELGFLKDTLDLGSVGTLTCSDTCLTYQGLIVCAPGDYQTEDSCHVYRFSVAADTVQPEVVNLQEICQTANENYTVQFLLNGLAPFSVNGGPITGNAYTSAPIGNEQPYAFVVTDGKGCQTAVTGMYDCGPSVIYMPNVIAPNSNIESNRYFTISAAPGRESIVNIEALRIYNRWGGCVWEKKDLPPNLPQLGWDGTNRSSQAVPTDTYMFWALLKLESGDVKQISGDVTVLK